MSDPSAAISRSPLYNLGESVFLTNRLNSIGKASSLILLLCCMKAEEDAISAEQPKYFSNSDVKVPPSMESKQEITFENGNFLSREK